MTARRGRWLATLTAVLIAAGGIIVPPLSATAAGTTVSGQAFRDYNGNGTFERVAVGNGPREMGLENVVVRAYDARGTVVGETLSALGSTTDAGGAWYSRGSYSLTLDASVAPGDPLRLEFTAHGFHDTFSATGQAPSLYSNASVRFIQAPASSVTGVDYGVSTPEDYSTTAPPIVSTIQSAGDPLLSANAARSEAAIVGQYWKSFYAADDGQNSTANGSASKRNGAGVITTAQYPVRNTFATFGEVGSVWGTAFQTSRNTLFASASYKRLAGLGPLGIGGIYRIPVTFATVDGQRSASKAAAAEPWLDVQGKPVANVPGATVDLGPALTNAQRGLGVPSDWTKDEHAFANAGRIGIGAITVSADDRWLYFVNLHDREVYRIDVSGPAVVTAATPHIERVVLNLPAGKRAWAVSEHHGGVYVGYVDEGTAWQANTALAATVVSATTDEISAAVAAGAVVGWKTELTVDLGYTKGPSYVSGTNTTRANAPWLWRWNSWVDTWSNPNPGAKGIGQQQPTGVGYDAGASAWNSVQTYPQAILSDIEFSDTNDLVLGLMDRTSLQAGNRNRAADDNTSVNGGVTGVNNRGYEAISSGDILIAAPNAEGEYVLERDGRLIDGRTSAKGNSGQGIGGREFFFDSNKVNGGANEYHPESTLGGIAAKTGYNGIIAAVIDPLSTVNVTGLKWFNTDNGNPVGGYQHTSQQTNPGSNSFQKGGGLGNVQTLAEQAPLQIGDRVWFDANRNGVQDPGEPPLGGIVVTATRADGTGTPLVTTTNADGAYLFSSTDANPLEFGTDYVISFGLPPGVDPTSRVFPGDPLYGAVTWGDFQLTLQRAGDGSRGEADSNPDPATGSFAYTTGSGGQNDHSLDAGYFADLTPTATIEKFDGDVDGTGAITRDGVDADTFDTGAVYESGESRRIVIRLTNTGPEPLKNVVLTDAAISGAAITSLRWWLPGASAPRDATWDAGAATWSYTWAETVDLDAEGRPTGYPATTWAVGDVIVGEATLTVSAGDGAAHRDEASFRADGAISGNPVDGANPYSAYTGAIQVIKYDGAPDADAPAYARGTDWVAPDKDA
ncbi:SdrD B-like domain-containing protein [Microbacterium sp. zg.Y909]|uniref:SdrD B-like domain-containing protein n=1 Tax=Microbacterium sp. zg.Y909 TaxID=2969413 RepID=UPI00214BABCE|nr:SdrD B-like domain-containing protein [Microbacterium sp. zg.Y909]MCR2825694.1 hypothetical protein [Microbacterium sp. zg.Y909]